MSSRDVDFNKLKYAEEYTRLVFNYQREHHREGFYSVMIHALQLAYIAGDWKWYEDLYKRTERKGMGEYRKFLEVKAKKEVLRK